MRQFCLLLTMMIAFNIGLENLQAQEPSKHITFPKPVMAVPDDVVLQQDFSQTEALNKSTWKKRQGTRWSIEDGVLRGIESSAEFQAQKKDHFGYEPRLSIPVTPAEFVAQFSFRFIGGQETAIVPFIEFGHHVCRIRFNKTGTTVISDGETMKLAEDEDFVWKSGQWYHATAEMKGTEFVINFVDGPTLYAKRDSFANSPKAGGNGLGVAGPRNGKVELDNLRIWTIKSEEAKNWAKTKEGLSKSKPVQIKKPKNKLKKK